MDPEEVCVHVSSAVPTVQFKLDGKPVHHVRKVELLEWKATGCTLDPISSSVYTNDIMYLDFDSSANSSGMGGHRIDAIGTSLGKKIVPVNWDKVVYLDAASTPVGEIGKDFSSPRIIASYPDGQGVLNECEITLKANSNLALGSPKTVKLAKATYTNLYLWLRITMSVTP